MLKGGIICSLFDLVKDPHAFLSTPPWNSGPTLPWLCHIPSVLLTSIFPSIFLLPSPCTRQESTCFLCSISILLCPEAQILISLIHILFHWNFYPVFRHSLLYELWTLYPRKARQRLRELRLKAGCTSCSIVLQLEDSVPIIFPPKGISCCREQNEIRIQNRIATQQWLKILSWGPER